MNLTASEDTSLLHNESLAAQALLRHEKMIVSFLTEGIKHNFFDYIYSNIKNLDLFYAGVRRVVHSLIQQTISQYIEGNQLKKSSLIELTRHFGKKKEVSYEELMLDFPVEYSLLNLNCAYHDGIFDDMNLTREQEDEMAKGICLGAHMTTFFLFVLFRYEIFQDFTFKRILKDFMNKNVHLVYPKLMKELAISRAKRFGGHLVFDRHQS